MGCVSSNLLNHEDEFTQLGSSALSHHIVSLTSTTYGLLSIDPPPSQSTHFSATTPSTPPSRLTLGSILPNPLSEPKSLWSEPRPLRSEPDVINSWELMAGLDTDSFRFYPHPPPKPYSGKDVDFSNKEKENSNPNRSHCSNGSGIHKPLKLEILKPSTIKRSLDGFERICPPNGENRVVIYTTTLRGVRKTFEACTAVRAAFDGSGVLVCERDVSMDRGFKQELRELMKGKDGEATVPPRVFVKGRYVGGAEEVLRIVEEGWLGELLYGLPRKRVGAVCEGCGDVRFLPCFRCNGSCKILTFIAELEKTGRSSMARCPDCNENGLVLCPLCT
ncbi:Glutaredoxin [Quillaja saponaria]|uniref:Glutaredoxin n=1 Tax=Quillaja saponaria TaxID=32244 RepID=A0AAD7PEJ2_QUISA|nr:Glutaredoxin [Quillaja saponaria]